MSASLKYDLTDKAVGRLGARFGNEDAAGKIVSKHQKDGSLASSLVPAGKTKEINVVKDYTWTLSNVNSHLDEIPYIRLIEYKMVESSIKRQIQVTTGIVASTLGNATLPSFLQGKSVGVLNPYKEIWPKDNPTGWSYRFPYFSKTGFELNSTWNSLEGAGDSIKQGITGVAEVLVGDKAKLVRQGLDIAQGTAEVAQAYRYPSTGVQDRPQIFSNHGERSVNINFTVFNTKDPDDWQDNRDLAYLLMNQNLFNKRDLTTGVPPVFYEVYIPGQYFCYAAAMTDIKVEHLGNQRLLYGTYIVPDAYQFSLTLTELVKPSKNQLEAVTSGLANNKVVTSTSNGEVRLTTQFS